MATVSEALDVTVKLDKMDGRLRVSVSEGHQAASATHDISVESLARVLGMWRQWKNAEVRDGDEFRKVGEELSSVALGTSINSSLQQIVGRASRLGISTQIRVSVSEPFANELPWELLRLAPVGFTDPIDGFVALHPNVRIFRNSTAPPEPPHLEQNLRILVVGADPGTPRFPRLAWIGAEARAIQAALARADRTGVSLETLFEATPDKLQRKLSEVRPQVVHFAGHAESRPNGGVFAMNGDRPGTENLLRASLLGKWLQDAGCRLAVLAACDTAGEESSPVSEILAAGVTTAVAMQAWVGDAYQPQFSRAFYGALLDGAPLDEAVSEVRQALAGPSGAWALPVLFCAGTPSALVGVPSLPDRSRSPNNLVSYGTQFFGRTRELTILDRALDESRLVTITGPGGIGKSRLANQCGLRSLSLYPGGIWSIDCGTIETADDLWTEIAGAIGLRKLNGSVEDSVIEKIADEKTLFLIEAYEGLAARGETSVIQSLIERSPASILVTSRMPLKIEGEIRVEAGPLSGDADPAAASRLFRDFWNGNRRNSNPAEAKAIGEICETLEGVPLAIILAAGRAKVLDLYQLRDLLRESAYQTLGGSESKFSTAIVRSINLIPLDDQEILWKLCVFSGGFAWDDIAKVYPVERFELLSGLERLVDKSLITQTETDDGKRFKALDVVRDTMAARIESNESASLRLMAGRRHAAHYVTKSNEIADLLKAGQWNQGASKLWLDIGNFRAALVFAQQFELDEVISNMSSTLCRTLFETGLWHDFERFATAGMAVATLHNDDPSKVALLGLMGAFHGRRGNREECIKVWQARAELCERIGDYAGAIDAATDIAAEYFLMRRYEEATALFDRADELLALVDRPDLDASNASARAMMEAERGNFEEAITLVTRALALTGGITSINILLFVRTNAGFVLYQCGRLSEALQELSAVVLEADHSGQKIQTAVALLRLSPVLEDLGKIEKSLLCLTTAQTVFGEIGSRRLSETQQAVRAFRERNADHPSVMQVPSRSPFDCSANIRLILEE